MSQVCFTTYFSEWGKGSREGYSILLCVRRFARVWFVQKWAGKVKIPAGWDEKYSGRMVFFIGWHEKKSGNTPRGREKIFVRTENSFRKMRIFPLKSPGKSAKMMKTGRKISQFPHEKNLKNIRIVRKDMPENPMTETKKSRFFFWKSSEKAKKLWKQTENFLSST